MKALAEQINDIDGVEIYGRVVAVRGLMVEVAGPARKRRPVAVTRDRPLEPAFMPR